MSGPLKICWKVQGVPKKTASVYEMKYQLHCFYNWIIRLKWKKIMKLNNVESWSIYNFVEIEGHFELNISNKTTQLKKITQRNYILEPQFLCSHYYVFFTWAFGSKKAFYLTWKDDLCIKKEIIINKQVLIGRLWEKRSMHIRKLSESLCWRGVGGGRGCVSVIRCADFQFF